MARKKTAAPKHVEPEEESQEVPEEEPESEDDEPAASGKTMSKTEAIRRAMAAGIETPEDGVDFILKNFGLELSRQHFSATRSKLKSQEVEKKPKGKPGRKPKQAPSQAVEGYLAPPPKPQAAEGETDLLAAMEAMKPLVAALGADKVKRIADLLS